MELKPEIIEDQVKNVQEPIYISKDICQWLRNTIKDENVLNELLESMLTPSETYFLRVNLSKVNIFGEYNPVDFLQEFINFYSEDCDVDMSKQFYPLINTLQLPYKKNAKSQLELHENIVYCDKFAAEAVNIGADLFVPGVTQIANSFEKNTKVSVLMDPNELQKKIKKNVRRKVNFSYHLLDGSINPRFHVCNGVAQMSTKEFTKVRNGIFIKNLEAKYPFPSFKTTPFYKEGLVSDQTFPSNLAMAIFSHHIIEENIKSPLVFDTCAAPGHKTTALSEWLNYYTIRNNNPDWIPITSIDRSKRRFNQLENDIKRLGLNKISIVPQHLEEFAKNQKPEEKADYIIFDPPCSALGNRGKLFIEKSRDDLEDYFRNQRRLLKIVDSLLEPGGSLMYNTCTIPIEENEQIVEYAMKKFNYTIVPIMDDFRKYGQPGFEFKSLCKEDDLKNLLRFYPRKNSGSGYFIALLKKPEDLTIV